MESNSVCNHTRDKQIGPSLRGRPILLLLVWLQTELDSTQSYYRRLLIVSTKFSIAIGIPRAYLSRNRRTITWVSNYRCPIWTFSNRIPVIGYPRDFRVNYGRFNGFLGNVFYSFQNLGKVLHTFLLKRSSWKTFLIPKFVIDTINISNWTSCRTIQGVIVLVFSNRPCALRSADFEITRTITPWIVLHSVQSLLLSTQFGVKESFIHLLAK